MLESSHKLIDVLNFIVVIPTTKALEDLEREYELSKSLYAVLHNKNSSDHSAKMKGYIDAKDKWESWIEGQWKKLMDNLAIDIARNS